jgi:diguanylate cyclase (GGDEF)-like protein/PAS domain S-box-containing protein
MESRSGQDSGPQRFAAVFTEGPAAQGFADLDGRYVAANRAYLRLLGVEHVDLVGRSVLELTHPDDREETVRLLQDLVEGRIGSFQMAKRYLHADGHAVPVLNAVGIVEVGGERFLAAVTLPRPLTVPGEDHPQCRHEALWRAGFHDSALPQAHVDASGRFADVNAALCELIGRTATQIVGRTPSDLTHAADAGDSDEALDRLLSGEATVATTQRLLRHASGLPIPASVFASAVVAEGRVLGASAAFQDLRVVHDAQRRLEQQTELFAALGERSHEVGVVTDADGLVVHVSPAGRPMFGYDPAAVVGSLVWDFVHPDDVADLREGFDELVAAGAGTRVRSGRVLMAAGGVRWVTVTMTNMLGSPLGGIVANIVDVTEQRVLQQQFELVEQRNKAIVDSLQEGVYVIDTEGKTVFANSKMAEILGLPLTMLYEVAPAQLLAEDEARLTADRLRTRLVLGPDRYEVSYAHPDGSTRILEVAAAPLAYGNDPMSGSLATVSDVTAARAVEQQLRDAALRDPLTGLPNRTLFMDRLEEALRRDDARVHVLLVDLDHFGLVNDVHGHAFGDRVLVQVAARLRGRCSPHDTIARLGGDRLAILTDDEGTSAADLASLLLAAVDDPIAVDGHEVRLSASIGVANGSGATATDVMRFADAARHDAKRAGRARARVFDRTLAEETEQAHALTADLHVALHDDALDAHYQPIVELASGKLLGVEMLARWTHPERGAVSPGVFAPLAERTGLARALDRWAIRRGLRDAGAFNESGALGDEGYVAINLSAKHLGDADLEDYVVAATSRAGLAPSRVTLEITESAIMHDVSTTLRVLERLRQRGYRVAIDDFGTGYSSLAYLRDLPITALKIDRSFVASMTEDNDSLAIAASIIDLARRVGLSTVAEGVETSEQAALLRSLGCEAAQGWLWSAALSPADIHDRGGWAEPFKVPAPTSAPRGRSRRTATADVDGEHGRDLLLALRDQGASLSTIAAALNRNGYATPEGLRWHRTSVARVLAQVAPDSAHSTDDPPAPG